MKRILFSALVVSLLVGCTQDVSVDEDFYHIPKSEVACVEQSRRELPINKSVNIQVHTELRCIFLMKESFVRDTMHEARQAHLKVLLKEGVQNANNP